MPETDQPEHVEPEDAGHSAIPIELIELGEILEWEAAVAAGGGDDGED